MSLYVWGIPLLSAHPSTTICIALWEMLWILFKMQTLILVVNKVFLVLYFLTLFFFFLASVNVVLKGREQKEKWIF